jgi:oligoendopeptidase F
MERKDVAIKDTWDLSGIFPSDEAWEAEFAAVEAETKAWNITAYQGKLGEKKALKELFETRDGFFRRIEKLYVYASMRHDEDIRVSTYNSYVAKMGSMVSGFMAAMAT